VSAQAAEARHDDQRALKDARARLRDEQALTARLERELGILAKVGQRSRPPAWLKSPKRSTGNHGTPWLFLSDLHLDEVVRGPEVLGVNAYNRSIAEARLARTFESTVKIARDYWNGVSYDGIVCGLGGDIFSGSIHEELTETNEDTMLGSLDHWIDPLAAGISLLAEEFGKVHVPVVVGNHGRTTRKPRHKKRVRDNFDWFIGKALERIFAADERVTFAVSESADLIVPSYGRTVLVTHGDQASGGAGIGGIWPPIMRLDARKRQRNAAVNLPYDLIVMGHWHQLVFGKGFIVNGSLKGYDEYAFDNNFGFEPPAQALWVMTPEHGMTFTSPVFPQDRKAEGW
jgi:predicted phosphodiesterase